VPATVSIEIRLPSVSLYVNYEGAEGFPDFISDISSGGFELTPADFPEHEDTLKALGISRIDLVMSADGAHSAMSALSRIREPVPLSIIKK
jgi:hypothetical protein